MQVEEDEGCANSHIAERRPTRFIYAYMWYYVTGTLIYMAYLFWHTENMKTTHPTFYTEILHAHWTFISCC